MHRGDSLPRDLANIFFEEELEAKGEGLVKAGHSNDGLGLFSRGTMKSLLIKRDGEATRSKQRLEFESLVAPGDDSDQMVKPDMESKIVLDKCIGKDSRPEG